MDEIDKSQSNQNRIESRGNYYGNMMHPQKLSFADMFAPVSSGNVLDVPKCLFFILNLWYWFWTFKRRVHGSSEINVLSHLLEHIQTILWVRFYWNHQRLWIKLISSPGEFFWLNKNQILGVRNFGGKYI